MASPGGKTKGLVVATRCTTLDEFIASFQRFCDESSFFVATLTTRPVGLETPFAILLADRSPVLRGLCTVLEAWTTADNKYKVPGIRLGVKRLTVETAPVFARLRPRVPVVPPPPSRPGRNRPMSVVLNPVPTGMRLPSTDMDTMDTIPPPVGPRTITGSVMDAIPLPIMPRTTTPISMPFPDPDPDALDADPDLPAVDKDGRMPGSELVLPANPLMNLTDDSLKGFIDCTLYESSPGYTRGVPVELSAAELPVLERVIERARQTIPPPFALPPEPQPDPPEIELVSPEPHFAFEPPPPVMTARAALPVLERPRRRWMFIAAPAMLAVALVAIMAVSASDADPGRPPPPEIPEPSARVALAPVAPRPSQPAAPQNDHTEDAEGAADPTATVDGVPLVGKGPCQLKISSTPAGSMVIVDGKSIGPSPIQLAGPCQRVKVDIKHPRYQLASEWVTLVEGTPGSVEVTMSRPTHRLKVVTVPAGATVSIGGRRAGTSPTMVQLMGFSNLPITIEKTGYKPVITKIYSKRADDKLNVKLSRW
ncbi:MAG TPA: PEGA domain-containing protein [Kofleriaceae bacterium]